MTGTPKATSRPSTATTTIGRAVRLTSSVARGVTDSVITRIASCGRTVPWILARTELISVVTARSVLWTAAVSVPVTDTARTEPVVVVALAGSVTVYGLAKPLAARLWTVAGAISSRLRASAVSVSDGLKLRYGLPPVSLAAERDASRTTEAWDW